LGLLQAELAAADDQRLAAPQLQARDVEGRVQHVAHAGLVADPALELADALLPLIGGGRHPRQRRRPYRVVEHMAPGASDFADDSMLRRVHREKVGALSGPRALLMMAAHPVAFEGFFMATGSLDDPYTRLRRTAEVMDAIAWRSKAEADRATRRGGGEGPRGPRGAPRGGGGGGRGGAPAPPPPRP